MKQHIDSFTFPTERFEDGMKKATECMKSFCRQARELRASLKNEEEEMAKIGSNVRTMACQYQSWNEKMVNIEVKNDG